VEHFDRYFKYLGIDNPGLHYLQASFAFFSL
jgi:hypothetical protein